jgi:putative effector of murein hydrolase
MTLVLIALTLGAYASSLRLRKRWNVPWTTPVLTTTAAIIAVLLIARVPPRDYDRVAPLITGFLVPASAALGVAIFKQRRLLAANQFVIGGGVAAGSAVTISIALLLAHLVHLGPVLTRIICVKSVTSAVAVQFAGPIHADPALTTVIVIAAGITGAVIGPTLLNLCGISNPLARGLALGAISHGIGTAQAMNEGEQSGAAASLAMCIVALTMSLVAVPLMLLLRP